MLSFILTSTSTNTFVSSATATTLTGMLIGKFLVGTGLGVSPAVASLYVTEVKQILIEGIVLA